MKTVDSFEEFYKELCGKNRGLSHSYYDLKAGWEAAVFCMRMVKYPKPPMENYQLKREVDSLRSDLIQSEMKLKMFKKFVLKKYKKDLYKSFKRKPPTARGGYWVPNKEFMFKPIKKK